MNAIPRIGNIPTISPLDITDEEFELISQTLQGQHDFRLAAYKDKCIKRRIAIRVRATHCATVREYCDILLSQPAEVVQLLKVLTIHVSQFFRNPPTFDKLRQEIIPYLFTFARQEGRPDLNCWSVGCAGGEEPYSLAMLLKEHFSDELARVAVTIKGTDVDAGVLAAARQGQFGLERLHDLPDYYRDRYFTEERGRFLLSPDLKRMVTFEEGNLQRDEAYPASDLILCRNVLIYFERSQQERIIRGFAQALRPGGILVLGKSETLFGESRRNFQTLCPVERIYRVV